MCVVSVRRVSKLLLTFITMTKDYTKLFPSRKNIFTNYVPNLFKIVLNKTDTKKQCNSKVENSNKHINTQKETTNYILTVLLHTWRDSVYAEC